MKKVTMTRLEGDKPDAGLTKEGVSQLTTPEKNDSTPRVIFFAGMTMNEFGSEHVRQMLMEVYGQENTQMFMSRYLSNELPPDHDQHIRDALHQALIEQRPTTLFLYSIGAVECVSALQSLLEEHPEAVQNLEHLDLVLLSPAGLVKGLETIHHGLEGIGTLTDVTEIDTNQNVFAQLMHKRLFQQLRRNVSRGRKKTTNAVQMGRRYMDIMLGAVVPQHHLAWVEGLNSFPPRIEAMSERDYMLALSQRLGERSQQSSLELTDKEIDTIWIEADNWRHVLDEPTLQKLDDFDREIIALLQDPDSDDRQLFRLLRNRTKLIHKKNQWVFSGEGVPANAEKTADNGPFWKIMQQTLLGFLHQSDALLGGDTVTLLKLLEQNGANMQMLIPEYDTFVKLEEIVELFPDSWVTMLLGLTHITLSNSASAQKEALQRVIKRRAEAANSAHGTDGNADSNTTAGITADQT